MLRTRSLNEQPTTFVAIVTVTFLYALTAYLGLFLAVPPGYATAIWIPSGIALGAALVWGLRIIPGVFLGSFLMNYYTTLNINSSLPLLTPFISGTIIATGASLQTAIGYYLIKRYVGLKNPLNEPKTIVLFGALTGPVSCLVNATWSNLLLLLFKILPIKVLLLSWTTWWIGDSMGVLIFTPLFLILFSHPRALWSPRITTVLLPLCVSFLAVVLMYLAIYNQELQHVKNDFTQLTTTASLQAETKTNGSQKLVDIIQKYFPENGNFYSITLTNIDDGKVLYAYVNKEPKPKPDQYFEVQNILKIQDKNLLLTAAPSNLYINSEISPVLWAVLLSGMFFCVLINAILFIINGQKSIDENLRFQKILESTPEAIVMYDASGNILFANRAFEKVFGYTKKEVIGQSINRLIPASGQKGPSKKILGYNKNGAEFPIEKTLSQVEILEGVVTLAVIRDITERMKLDQLKTDFISIVSHELRTPLTSIQGVLSLLTAGLSEYELNQKSSRLLLLAKKNCARLIRLINDILDIDKIESGKNLFHFTEVQIPALIEETVNLYKPYAKDHNITIEVEPCSEELSVRGDHDRLCQVLTNLISNATKFSPPGSPIIVACKKINNKVRVSVTDLGQGMTEEFKSKIFQKFAQEDSSSARKHSGSGLGLSISKSIIERHNGVIDYICNNKGTTFYFELSILYKMETAASE